jgi:hypothetical protein
MAEPTAFGMRVDCQQYLELPEGHRTTFVAGMNDMMEYVTTFVEPARKRQFQTALEKVRELESEKVRRLMDDYGRTEVKHLKTGAASAFLVMLVKKSAS